VLRVIVGPEASTAYFLVKVVEARHAVTVRPVASGDALGEVRACVRAGGQAGASLLKELTALPRAPPPPPPSTRSLLACPPPTHSLTLLTPHHNTDCSSAAGAVGSSHGCRQREQACSITTVLEGERNGCR
jgi:hypothetical protein